MGGYSAGYIHPHDDDHAPAHPHAHPHAHAHGDADADASVPAPPHPGLTMDRRLLAVGAFVLALGGTIFFVTADPNAPAESRPTTTEKKPVTKPTPIAPRHVEEEVAAEPTPALVRAGPQPGDDVEQRRRLEQQAVLAAPYWAQIAPRIQDAGLRTEATEMFERLNRLDEPAADLARAQYDLTQTLISKGGLDRKSKAALDYLNSTSAAVLQNGDPSLVIKPEEALKYRPGQR